MRLFNNVLAIGRPGYDEHKEVVKVMMLDPELLALIKLVEAGLDTPEVAYKMLNGVYYRSLATVREGIKKLA